MFTCYRDQLRSLHFSVFAQQFVKRTHSYLPKQWLIHPVCSRCCFSMKQFYLEEKLIIINELTEAMELCRVQSLGRNHGSFCISKKQNWRNLRVYFQTMKFFCEFNYSASACSKEGRTNEITVMKPHRYWMLYVWHMLDIDHEHKSSLAKM